MCIRDRSSSSSNVMQMDQKGDKSNDNQQKNNTQTKENFLGNMMEGPSNQELEMCIRDSRKYWKDILILNWMVLLEEMEIILKYKAQKYFIRCV